MKMKIFLILITVIYFSDSKTMDFENTDSVRTGYIKTITFSEMTKRLKTPIILNPTNEELIEALSYTQINFQEGGLKKTIQALLLSFIKSKNDNPLVVKTINLVMTSLLFELNKKKEGSLANPKTSSDYLEIFPILLDEICKTEPQDLRLKAAWQILSVMPALFDVFQEMGYIKDAHPAYFDVEFEAFKSSEGYKYLSKYLDLIAKVAQSEFPEDCLNQKEILLARLVQKLGANLGFLDSIENEIEEIPVFKNKLDKLEKDLEFLKDSQELTESILENHPEALILEKQINLIHKEITDFKHQLRTNINTLHKIVNMSWDEKDINRNPGKSE